MAFGQLWLTFPNWTVQMGKVLSLALAARTVQLRGVNERTNEYYVMTYFSA